ncbi:MAG: uncharacterized protein QOG64_324 [Acidimicrobiaceae bacterium]|nr:uncharacterized protein [Acidimicrobiaceae bacterium]
MTQSTPDDDHDLVAGRFSSWLAEMQAALRGDRGSDVPCAGCTACCTSSQFIHIGPDETKTLSRIPADLLFPAPRMPKGHVVLGYDERGHCPMLVDNRCSIYQDRPRTCRTYDCRVFPAAGVAVDEVDKDLIRQRTRRWQFSFPSEVDRTRHAAVRAAAMFLEDHASLFPDGAGPSTPTQRAVLAIEVHDLFLQRDDANRLAVVEPDPNVVVEAVIRRSPARGA